MTTLVIAPHADDELLGCGGTLLRRRAEGIDVAWILDTEPQEDRSGPDPAIREREVHAVREGLGIAPDRLVRLNYPTTTLDMVPMSELVTRLASEIGRIGPSEVLIPHPADVHSDHRCVAEATIAATKWFRQPGITRVLAYETLSETEFGGGPAFRPDVYIDVSPYLDEKIVLLRHYASELGAFPFPRSETAVRALAAVRGATAGFTAAESFQIITAREPLSGTIA